MIILCLYHDVKIFSKLIGFAWIYIFSYAKSCLLFYIDGLDDILFLDWLHGILLCSICCKHHEQMVSVDIKILEKNKAAKIVLTFYLNECFLDDFQFILFYLYIYLIKILNNYMVPWKSFLFILQFL